MYVPLLPIAELVDNLLIPLVDDLLGGLSLWLVPTKNGKAKILFMRALGELGHELGHEREQEKGFKLRKRLRDSRVRKGSRATDG